MGEGERAPPPPDGPAGGLAAAAVATGETASVAAGEAAAVAAEVLGRVTSRTHLSTSWSPGVTGVPWTGDAGVTPSIQ